MSNNERDLTEQELFWMGSFGDEYIKRNSDDSLIENNFELFKKVFSQTGPIDSVIEFGANIGLNLKAINKLIPDAELSAVELNSRAVEQLENWGKSKNYNSSLLDFQVDYLREFVLVKTVLIHINPQMLSKVYDLLYRSSKRYICIVEYYNPTPVEIEYRGHTNKLFKRDFAGDMLDRFKDLKLVDYGFVYHRDRQFPQDDVTWFLLEKCT